GAGGARAWRGRPSRADREDPGPRSRRKGPLHEGGEPLCRPRGRGRRTARWVAPCTRTRPAAKQRRRAQITRRVRYVVPEVGRACRAQDPWTQITRTGRRTGRRRGTLLSVDNGAQWFGRESEHE